MDAPARTFPRWLLPIVAVVGPAVFGAGGAVMGARANQQAIIDLRTDMNASLKEIKETLHSLGDQRVSALESRVTINATNIAALTAWKGAHERQAAMQWEMVKPK